jgi:hypothetical protein
MTTVRFEPGPLSTHAFNLGALAAVLLACAVSGLCLWNGILTLSELVVLNLFVLPPYLLLVASALGVWLGFGGGARARARPGGTRESDVDREVVALAGSNGERRE